MVGVPAVRWRDNIEDLGMPDGHERSHFIASSFVNSITTTVAVWFDRLTCAYTQRPGL